MTQYKSRHDQSVLLLPLLLDLASWPNELQKIGIESCFLLPDLYIVHPCCIVIVRWYDTSILLLKRVSTNIWVTMDTLRTKTDQKIPFWNIFETIVTYVTWFVTSDIKSHLIYAYVIGHLVHAKLNIYVSRSISIITGDNRSRSITNARRKYTAYQTNVLFRSLERGWGRPRPSYYVGGPNSVKRYKKRHLVANLDSSVAAV